MPRNLTTYTKAARSGILALIERHPENKPLPSLRQLAEDFDLHSTTIFRLLHDLETEGKVWQGPSRRFFPASAQSHALRGAPVCFIGRKIQQWSQLYQEIIEGVAEVCTANGSPLILHSAPTLVRVPVPLQVPLFASAKEQKKEMAKLASTIPRGCAGFLFDHLWSDLALDSVSFPSGQKIQLLSGSGKHTKVISPKYSAGAKIIADYIKTKNFDQICLVITDDREPLFNKCIDQLREILDPSKTQNISFYDNDALKQVASRPNKSCCFVCPEDNISVALASSISQFTASNEGNLFEVVAIQGTGVVTSPHTRLRYDYRRLGRAAASSILHGTAIKQMSPRLVTHGDDDA